MAFALVTDLYEKTERLDLSVFYLLTLLASSFIIFLSSAGESDLSSCVSPCRLTSFFSRGTAAKVSAASMISPSTISESLSASGMNICITAPAAPNTNAAKNTVKRLLRLSILFTGISGKMALTVHTSVAARIAATHTAILLWLLVAKELVLGTSQKNYVMA